MGVMGNRLSDTRRSARTATTHIFIPVFPWRPPGQMIKNSPVRVQLNESGLRNSPQSISECEKTDLQHMPWC